MKGFSCKQIIIPMGSNNSKKFLTSSGDHVTNMNCALKSIKFDIVIDFIRSDHRGLIVVSNFKTLDFPSPNLISRFWEFLISLKIQTPSLILM